ncbi:MAG: hypothetical protein WBA38_04260 [Gordonia sp. (in: high G+C Gram-positive bacteria)]|uniref:hypothetical protein n=1 Tax=Gordonia sp. (in: high G+C Gram-positive bacteria) TaxID=84139 RepID=UPI003C75772B
MSNTENLLRSIVGAPPAPTDVPTLIPDLVTSVSAYFGHGQSAVEVAHQDLTIYTPEFDYLDAVAVDRRVQNIQRAIGYARAEAKRGAK